MGYGFTHASDEVRILPTGLQYLVRNLPVSTVRSPHFTHTLTTEPI